jgi:hypothetical protein
MRPRRRFRPLVSSCRSPSLECLVWRAPQRRRRTATAQPPHVPPDLNWGLRCVVPPYPARWPDRRLLFVGAPVCAPASSPRSVTLPQLPSDHTCRIFPGRTRRFTSRGREPHEFAPMMGVYQALKQTPGGVVGSEGFVVVRHASARGVCPTSQVQLNLNVGIQKESA